MPHERAGRMSAGAVSGPVLARTPGTVRAPPNPACPRV